MDDDPSINGAAPARRPRFRLTTCLRSVPYASLLAFAMAVCGLSVSAKAWNTFYARLSVYIVVPHVAENEHFLYLALAIAPITAAAGLVLGLLATGAVQEHLCASRRTCVTRFVGRLLAAVISIAAYLCVFVDALLLAGFAAVASLLLIFDYACDEAADVSSSTCVDLSQFGLGDDYCGPHFEAFCADLRHLNHPLATIFAGILLLAASQLHVLVCQTVNFNRIKDRVDKSRAARVWRDEFYALPPEHRPLLRHPAPAPAPVPRRLSAPRPAPPASQPLLADTLVASPGKF